MSVIEHIYRNVAMRTARVFMVTLFLSAGACSDSLEPKQVSIPQNEVLSALVVMPQAFILAVNGDSVKLMLTGLNLNGDPLPIPDSAPVRWRTNDTRFLVDSNGWVRARGATTINDLAYVIASWTYNGATRVDTVIAFATATKLSIAGLKIMSSDSARSSMNRIPEKALQSEMFSLLAVDSIGRPVATPRVSLTVTNKGAEILSIGQLNLLFGISPVEYWVHASSNVYGVLMQDSAKYQGLYPSGSQILIQEDTLFHKLNSLQEKTNTEIQPCGEVQFKNNASVPIDVVFEGLGSVNECRIPGQTGDILNLAMSRTATRKFPTLGTFRWTVRKSAGSASEQTISGTITTKTP